MARRSKGKNKKGGGNSLFGANKKKEELDEIAILPGNTEGIHRTNDGFSIIDDEVITPRAFDRTTKDKRTGRTAFNFTKNFEKEEGKRNYELEEAEKKYNNGDFGETFPNKNEPFNKMIFKESFYEKNEQNKNNNQIFNNSEYGFDFNAEQEVDTTERTANHTAFTKFSNVNIFDNKNDTTNNEMAMNFRMDETPVKSNINKTPNGDTESSAKKYRTPGEIDMLEPDESLIGNKCVTINNYVSPPKFFNRVGSFSRFPLSGEADINPLDYNGFRNMFKNCACVISEQEYLESTSKESFTNPMQALEEEDETEGESEERSGESRNRENENENRNNRNREERRRQGNRNQNYDLHETPNKFSRSQTAFPLMSGTRLGNSPNKNVKTKGKTINTTQLLQELDKNKLKKDKSRSAYETLDDNGKGKDVSNKKFKTGNEDVVELIDFEIKPVFKKNVVGKTKENNQHPLMDELIKKKKNPLKIPNHSYSEELNIVFKKNCEIAKEMYHAYNTLNFVIKRRTLINEPLYFRIIKKELNSIGGGHHVTEELLRKIAWIAPCLITLNKVVVRKEILDRHTSVYPEYETGKKIEDIEVRENTNEKLNIFKLSNIEKYNLLQKIIVAWINVKHNEFLKKLNPEYYLPQYYELKKWHSAFQFSDVVFPSLTLTEDKVAARLSFTPHESNTDDFIVENDSPLKTVLVEFETHQQFVNDMENTKTRTPLGRSRRRSNFGSPFSSPINYSSSPKKETKNMKLIREDANKKKIISQIKNELEEEEQKLLNEKKYWESAKWIGEIIHDMFVVEGTHTVIELLVFAKKISDKYKNTHSFDMNEKKIAEIIETLANYIPDINIKPGIIDKKKVNLSVRSKKNLHYFLEPISKKAEVITKRYSDLKANKENRLRELWVKYEVSFELTENMKKFFLNPGSITISDL